MGRTSLVTSLTRFLLAQWDASYEAVHLLIGGAGAGMTLRPAHARRRAMVSTASRCTVSVPPAATMRRRMRSTSSACAGGGRSFVPDRVATLVAYSSAVNVVANRWRRVTG